MTFLLATARKDLARWRQDPLAALLWLGFPFLIGGLLTLMIGGDVKPQGRLLINDQDDTFISGAIAAAFSQGQLGELVVVEQVNESEGRSRIDDGDASAFLLIPAGFGDALLDGTPLELTLRTNPSQTILPGIIEDVIEILLDAGFYLQTMFGDEIDRVRSAGNVPDDRLVAEIAVAVNRKLDSTGQHFSPLAFDLAADEEDASEPALPVAVLFLPGIVMMALLFAGNSLASDIWEEREAGTLRRLVVAPGRLTGFVAGKIAAVALVMAALAGITLLAGLSYHGLPLARLPLALLWAAAGGVAMFAWFMLLQTLARTKRAANLLTTLLLFPLMMLGGSFFPFAAMPDGLAVLGQLTPNGFIVQRLGSEIEGLPAAVSLIDWLGVCLAGGAGIGLLRWRLQGAFARDAA